MLCDICHKNEAMIHIQELGPEGRTNLNLCFECAIKKTVDKLNGNPSEQKLWKKIADYGLGDILKAHGIPADLMSFQQLLQNQSADGKKDAASEGIPAEETTCPQCGMTLSEFTKPDTPVLGCPGCSVVFKEYLTQKLNLPFTELLEYTDSLKTIPQQRKRPSRNIGQTQQQKMQLELERLKRELACAVRMENYERAAHLRDLIDEYSQK